MSERMTTAATTGQATEATTSQHAPFAKRNRAADPMVTPPRIVADELITIEDIPLDAIEPDPAQHRRVFDEARLRSLAASIQNHGLLQEPGVFPVAVDSSGRGSRFRLIWGERRWRAAGLAGLRTIRCKVHPNADASASEQLRAKEKQWAENMEREGLSPLEEAIAIQDAVDLAHKLSPQVLVGDLVEKVAVERGLNGIVARNLVGLLRSPRCLQSAVQARAIGREVAFELGRYWNRLLTQNELQGSAKREIQFRNLIEAWARARGSDLDAHAMEHYAAETFQDAKIVKTTCRRADESQKAVLDRFASVVERAVKQRWTVVRAKAALGVRARGERAARATALPLFEKTTKASAAASI